MAWIDIKIQTDMLDADMIQDLTKYIRQYPHKAEEPFCWSAFLRPPVFHCKFEYSSGKDSSEFAIFRFIEEFFRDLGAAFPMLSAAVYCQYEPNQKNLDKGYDDFGGYYTITLEKGTVTAEDCAIV